jgi:hypothetical protein
MPEKVRVSPATRFQLSTGNSGQAALVEDEPPLDDELLEEPVDDVEEDDVDDVDDSEVEDFAAVAGDVEGASEDDFDPLGLLPLVRLSFR